MGVVDIIEYAASIGGQTSVTHMDLPRDGLAKFTVENSEALKRAGCGILTTADAKFFQGLQLLAYSTKGLMPLAVVDLGLTYPQQVWCDRYKITMLEPPTDAFALGPDWKYYCKPLLIRDSPFQNTLWLDSDCMLVGDPTPMFETIIRKPFVVEHWHSWMGYHPNSDAAYQYFPVKRFPISCNCGVPGFNPKRDHVFMRVWIEIVTHVASNPELRKHVSYWDEGCLHIAAQMLQMPEIVEKHRGWNQPLFLRMPGFTDSFEEFVQRLPVPGFDDVVYHASSSPKCWEFWK